MRPLYTKRPHCEFSFQAEQEEKKSYMKQLENKAEHVKNLLQQNQALVEKCDELHKIQGVS